MLKRITNTALAILLAFLMLLNGVSHEFIHTFTGHEDTVDKPITHHGQFFFEKEHHHCEFLNFHAAAYVASGMSFQPCQVFQHQDSFLLNAFSFQTQTAKHTALRGPPTLA